MRQAACGEHRSLNKLHVGNDVQIFFLKVPVTWKTLSFSYAHQRQNGLAIRGSW